MYHLPSSRASVLIFGINIAVPATACVGHRATAIESTARAARALAFLGLVDFEHAALKVLSIQCLDGARGVGARHLDETETARATGIPIGDQRHGLHCSMGREQRTHRGLG